MMNLGNLLRKIKPLEDDERTRLWLVSVAVDADICSWSVLAKDIRSKITIEMANATDPTKTP